MSELPAGLTVRPPRLEDADAILQLAVDYFTKLLGRPVVTLSEVTEALGTPTFTPERDGWLVLGRPGAVTGFAFVLPGGDRRFVQLSVITPDPAIAGWLVTTGAERARDLAGENGQTEVTVEVSLFRADEALREVVSDQGYEFATSYLQLRIDHTGPVLVPEPPAGTTVRAGAFDESARRAYHALMSAAFEGQDSAALPPYDEWLANHEKSPQFAWPQLTMVERDGVTLAASDCNDSFVETDNCGYIGRLGVSPEARGLGLAKYLLRYAFAADAAAGLDGTMLHVDTNNPTPALGLYESVGMRTIEIADAWTRKLPTR
ncbi:GNAT family N-acetyltransferase [Kribbella catacumbae]|uniref:GNAT family N-acetyltransferase n=1 Tax=Kribbella catacumbae TaxID=460086 RepID=UPI00037C6EFC|nr:GNAT family N-acetyltransferase [Kribbella catacumbae]